MKTNKIPSNKLKKNYLVMGKSSLAPHSLQLPSYTGTEDRFLPRRCKANVKTAALTPEPHVVTTLLPDSRMTPASSNIFFNSSADLKVV